MNLQLMIAVAVGVWIAYRIYRRVRRTFGWQEMKVGKLRFSTIALSVIGLVFLAEGAAHPVSFVSDLIGIALGAALACCGAATTRFEQQGGRRMYRANPWIGGAVTVLFFGRFAFRIYELLQPGYYGDGVDMAAQLRAMSSSWTSGLLLIMFAYYIAYNMLLMRRASRAASA